uniref:Uncharacterized LOC111656236 n=1 Tax=Seriola lalandi dorsalis TaxID=1841481 RepID=A0A3B4XP38_SERLL
NVSAVFDTQITPSGWTFSIWSVIYIWLTAMIIYILASLCRSPAVLPYGFFISWCINLCFNIGWLLVWDRVMIAALVFLILVICTNYSMICFICHGLHIYGPWLKKYHNADLWLLRVLQVQNGVMIYTTWTTIATLINLTIVLTYDVKMSPTDAAFILENIVLDKHVRYILVIYPVVIWALAGNLDKNYDAESPTRNGIFI